MPTQPNWNEWNGTLDGYWAMMEKHRLPSPTPPGDPMPVPDDLPALIAELELSVDSAKRYGCNLPYVTTEELEQVIAALKANGYEVAAEWRDKCKTAETQRDELAKALEEVGRAKIVKVGETPDKDNRELCWCHCNSDRCVGETRCLAAAEVLAKIHRT